MNAGLLARCRNPAFRPERSEEPESRYDAGCRIKSGMTVLTPLLAGLIVTKEAIKNEYRS